MPAFREVIISQGTVQKTVLYALTPKEQNKIIAYLNTFLIYDEVYCGGNDFFLAHTVPEKKRMEQFDKLLWQEFITGEPEYEKEYFPERYIVTGHTPTGFIEKAYKGRIYIKKQSYCDRLRSGIRQPARLYLY